MLSTQRWIENVEVRRVHASIYLLICNRIYREGLRQILIDRRAFTEVHACCDIEALRSVARAARAGVVAVDIAPGEAAGCNVAAIAAARVAAPGVPVIALGLDGGDEEVLASVEAGASGFVTKNDSLDDLVYAIRAAAAGEFRCGPRISRLMQERLTKLAVDRNRTARLDRLSQREQHILSLMSEDLSNKQIARQLGLAVSTIKNHVHNIIVKLSVTNRIEAAALTRAIRAESHA
jgi:two-component system nitrate/nitrite response regulator NarL